MSFHYLLKPNSRFISLFILKMKSSLNNDNDKCYVTQWNVGTVPARHFTHEIKTWHEIATAMNETNVLNRKHSKVLC